MKLNERIEQRADRHTINDVRMTSTTSRYPLKPKTLTLLELCQTINDFRHPPPSITSYQYQQSTTASQILTRRLYLHPLTINSHSKYSSSKYAPTPTDSEQPLLSNRDKHHKNKKSSSHQNLAILSSSFPLKSRLHSKPDNRHTRDKISLKSDDDTNSDFDTATTIISFNQPSLLSLARGTTSSTHTTCTRPSCVKNHQRIYQKTKRWDKVDVWNSFDRALQRPMPVDPPTTPLSIVSDVNTDNDELQNQYSETNSIHDMKIFNQNLMVNSIINDDYMYNED